MENVSALHLLVIVVGTLASLLGGYQFAHQLPALSSAGLAGELLGAAAVVFLVLQGVPTLLALLPILIGSAGTLFGILARSRR